ncbi:hypothetical protein [Mycetocola zhadangensis]|uniref:Transposase DDE domain-containing protein n=1 Tax=Mycetocola zhadangensis TaxID=1164595 RepID=A0A3L7J0M7_9MICO|nr:hypothetical protein [Mycetocola zhadangensis]RLQ84028.1 hypothetical protein D9V28_07220 [Mycetocola zhadangensis]GGE96784.1 hypothetical protein GCM10011313_19740 [Mycetocola zhadangensis]
MDIAAAVYRTMTAANDLIRALTYLSAELGLDEDGIFRDSSHREYGDFELYNKRVDARTPYLLKRNGSEDTDGYSTWMCPAGSRNPTLTCDIKTNMGVNDPASPYNIGRRKSLMPVINMPRQLKGNSICTNKTSVKFPPKAGAKYFQHLQYGTEDWRAMYSTARNTIEGFNAFVKDPGREALDAAARRRLRGVTVQYFLTTLLVAAANLRKISTFLDGINSAITPEKKVQKRARRRELTPLSPWATAPRTKAKAPPG